MGGAWGGKANTQYHIHTQSYYPLLTLEEWRRRRRRRRSGRLSLSPFCVMDKNVHHLHPSNKKYLSSSFSISSSIISVMLRSFIHYPTSSLCCWEQSSSCGTFAQKLQFKLLFEWTRLHSTDYYQIPPQKFWLSYAKKYP
jgi:hypothetical protein